MFNISSRRGAYVLVAALMTMILLAACAEDEPAEIQASPTTAATDTFDITGAVVRVDIEPDEATPSPTETATEEADQASPSPTATASPQALILVSVDSIDSATAELCDVSEGDSITLTVGVGAEVSPQREFDELEQLEGLTVRADGTAEKTEESPTPEGEESPTPEEGEESPTPEEGATASPTGEDGAGCDYEVTALTVVEEADQTPTPRGAEDGDNGSPSPQVEGDDTDSPTPERTATPTPTGGADD